jgi:hypothetical protein
MTPPNLQSRRPAGWAGFLVFQIVILGTGVGWAAYRAAALSAERALPHWRNEPLEVAPLYDDPEVVSDEQLRAALGRLVPRFRGKRVSVASVDHAIRFWGPNATFADPDCLSGEELRRLLLDHKAFAAYYGAETPALLVDTDAGVRLRVQEGVASSSHYDHTLAGLAEVGTPLDFPVRTPERQTTLAAVLEQSLRDFSLNQVEYEWSALAYALYLPPSTHWVSTEGQTIDFDRLARRIMRQRLPQGVCLANHRMHALVVLLRVNEQIPILSEAGRIEITDYLKRVTEKLVASQHAEGYWTRQWPGGEEGESSGGRLDRDPLLQQILATGHPLEWWALAPVEVQPPHEVVKKAAQWICRTIDDLSPEQIESYYSPLSHAGRALTLWRGRLPHEVALDSPPLTQGR